MDPLSVAASIGSLSGACLVTLKNLNDFVGKFITAPRILRNLSSEIKVISISLSQLRNVIISDEHSVLNKSLLKPDIRNALDVALTGCQVTLSCLETEIQRITANIAPDQKITSLAGRAKIAYKHDKFKELLPQLNRQYSAIAMLVHTFQMKAIGEILSGIAMSGNRALIQKVAEDTESLRGLYPKSNAAKSFLDSLEWARSNEINFSVISEQQFEFDDLVTNSQAYRRVLVAATHALKKNTSGTAEEIGEVSELTSEGVQSRKGSNGTVGANQSRKMSAAPAMARASKQSPIATSVEGPGPQDNQSQQSTIKGTQSFAQQIRGYLDHVEEESRDAAKENAQLRERLAEKEAAAEAIFSQLQNVTVRANQAEQELEFASKDLAHYRTSWQDLTIRFESVAAEKNKLITQLESQMDSVEERAWKAEQQLEVAEAKVAKKETDNINLVKWYEAELAKVKVDLREEHEHQANSLRINLEAWKAETASAKKELEELRAVQRDLSVLFQKGNSLLHGPTGQVIDREK